MGWFFLKAKNTLLVGANSANVHLITKIFDRFSVKHKFNVVKDYAAAVDYLYKRGKYNDAETPDLIILNLNLSNEKDIEVIEKDEKLRLIPLICLNNFSRWLLNHSMLFKVLMDWTMLRWN